MTPQKRYSRQSAIATATCNDIGDVSHYQYGLHNPPLFNCGDHPGFYCALRKGEKLPKLEFSKWKKVGDFCNYTVYESEEREK